MDLSLYKLRINTLDGATLTKRNDYGIGIDITSIFETIFPYCGIGYPTIMSPP